MAQDARSEDLPAYRLQSPVREQQAGFAPFLAGRPRVEPPAPDVVAPIEVACPEQSHTFTEEEVPV